jgi:hypothetical protein
MFDLKAKDIKINNFKNLWCYILPKNRLMR